ncbi:MAG: hypothetical protein ACAI44_17250 [Candidatus Sericytochromatia bacterium]
MSFEFAGHYAQIPLGPLASRWLEAEELELTHGPDDSFACVGLENSAGASPNRELLQMLSSQGGRAIYLCIEASEGCFEYQHWHDGQRTRTLGFVAGQGWQEAEGEPEPWERECFFNAPEEPDAYLHQLQQEWKDLEALARERERLNEIWASGRIQIGLPLPEAQEERAAQLLANFYGFELFP